MGGASEEGGSPSAQGHDDDAFGGTTPGGYSYMVGDPDGDASVESGEGEGDDFDHRSYSSQSHSQEDGSSSLPR